MRLSWCCWVWKLNCWSCSDVDTRRTCLVKGSASLSFHKQDVMVQVENDEVSLPPERSTENTFKTIYTFSENVYKHVHRSDALKSFSPTIKQNTDWTSWWILLHLSNWKFLNKIQIEIEFYLKIIQLLVYF